MSETQELQELKREVVEARNQAIKTDNQVRNMALDVKGFEKRFDALERRTRIASLGVHAIVALTIAGAAFVVTTVRSSGHTQELAALQADMTAVRAKADKKETELNEQLRAFEELKARGKASREAAAAILNLLDNKKDKEASELLPKVHLDDLSELERKLVSKTFTDLRKRSAEGAYRAGKTLLNAGKEEAAIKEFARSLKLEPQGAFAERARYLQATTLYTLKRYDQASPLLKQLHKHSQDKALLDEVRYLLGLSLARSGKREEAKVVLKEAASKGKYQGSARTQLAALEAGTPLPE